MRIGFDVSQTGKSKAGCGFFTENLIAQLASIDSDNHYFLYPTFGDHFWDHHSKSTYFIKLANFHRGFKQKNIFEAKKFWRSSSQYIEKKLENIDILHSNNFYCPPKLSQTKLIYTLYDLSFIEYPECTTEHNRIACFEGVFKASLYADRIIAISECTKKHFLQLFPHYPAERIVVVYPASRFENSLSCEQKLASRKTVLDVSFRSHDKNKKLQPEQFWLNVGTIEPRKNIKRLLKAYAKLRAIQPQTYPLVLAGKLGWLADDIKSYIRDLGLQQHVHLLGYINNEELQWLYQHCFCLVYPSLFEGFGLPALEAMTFGAPVITSNVSSLPEVVGQAGKLVNPLDEDDIMQAMLNMYTQHEDRARLKTAAVQQAKLFSWEKSAKTILNLYNEVIASPQRHYPLNDNLLSEPLKNTALS